MKTVALGDQKVGSGKSAYIVAEIGINHNGDLEIAKRLIDAAKLSGCNAVKFQKRTPSLCIPTDQKKKMRETPWGYVTYLEYKNKLEFGLKEYKEINRYCKKLGITWFASCWDRPSIDFVEKFKPVCFKVPSAMLTDDNLLKHFRKMGRPIILSTGMSTIEQIRHAVDILGIDNLIIAHCTSTYPCTLEELNLQMIHTLTSEFDCPIGYSGHETGLAPTVAAAAMGACYIERHITLDRAIWGTDQAASVETIGMVRLVKDIRAVERAMGDGVKKVYDSELPVMERLRLRAS